MPPGYYKDGEVVNIRYTGYVVTAKILGPDIIDGREIPGWYSVEQISDYEEYAEGERPHYAAHEDFIFRDDDPTPPSPLESLAGVFHNMGKGS